MEIDVNQTAETAQPPPFESADEKMSGIFASWNAAGQVAEGR
jgi:hypothetical protein